MPSEIYESTFLSSDSISAFLHLPWDRNTMWYAGRPQNRLLKSSQDPIGEFIHYRIYCGKGGLFDFGKL
jgi:hypothetical protein